MTEDLRTRPSETFAFILRLIELLRPRFYNRITWLIVISGIAMMSIQLWEAIAIAALKRQFDISISGSNDVVWGFALCVLGLVYHIANTGLYELLRSKQHRDRKQQEVFHDKQIFSKANKILTEEQVVDIIETLENDHSYYFNEAARLSRYSRFLAATSNRFLDEPLTKRVRNFVTASDELGTFLSSKFFVFPKGQTGPNTRLCMSPGLNMDRDGDGSREQSQKYEVLTSDLEMLTRNFMQRYLDLRTSVKTTLVI